MPMGLSLKQLVQGAPPFNPCTFDSSELYAFLVGSDSTLGEIGGGSWGARCGFGISGAFSSSVSGSYGTTTWNGITMVGNSTAHYYSVSGYSSAVARALSTGAPGGDANDLTLYFVLLMGSGSPQYGMFQYGTHDATFGGTQEKEFQIEFFSSPSSFSLVDTTGIIGATDLYTDNYLMPTSMTTPTAGVLTVQTSRNSNHRARWQQVDLVSTGTTHTGTVQPLTFPNFMYMGGLNDTTNIISTNNYMGNCFIGMFLGYAALHNNSQINEIEGYLRTYWSI